MPQAACSRTSSATSKSVHASDDPRAFPSQCQDAAASVADRWLANQGGVEFLQPAPEDFLQWWPVSRRVNAVGRVDDAILIEPLTA